MSLHADALASLAAWTPPTPAQRELRERYVAHLRVHRDGLSRDCYPDHLTASVIVFSHDHAQVLLTLHAKARRWFQLGGHCEDGDQTLAGAARREALEESGISGLVLSTAPVHLSEHAVPFCDARGGVRHLDVRYAAVAPPAAEHAVSEESLDLRWWPVAGLPDAELAELVGSAQASLSAPSSSSSNPISRRAAAE